jgi:hypothetical protein
MMSTGGITESETLIVDTKEATEGAFEEERTGIENGALLEDIKKKELKK